MQTCADPEGGHLFIPDNAMLGHRRHASETPFKLRLGHSHGVSLAGR